MKKDIIVILNDNKMSIAPNVWTIQNSTAQSIIQGQCMDRRQFINKGIGAGIVGRRPVR